MAMNQNWVPPKKRWFIPTLPYRGKLQKHMELSDGSCPSPSYHPLRSPASRRGTTSAWGSHFCATVKKMGMLKTDEKYLGFADLGSPQEITLIFTIDFIDSPVMVDFLNSGKI